MWLASRKPLSIKEHSRIPFLVSRHFCYTFVHIPTLPRSLRARQQVKGERCGRGQGRHIFWLFWLASGASAASGVSGKCNLPHVFPFSAASRSNSAVIALCLELSSFHTFKAAQPSFLLASNCLPGSESYALTHSYCYDSSFSFLTSLV